MLYRLYCFSEPPTAGNSNYPCACQICPHCSVPYFNLIKLCDVLFGSFFKYHADTFFWLADIYWPVTILLLLTFATITNFFSKTDSKTNSVWFCYSNSYWITRAFFIASLINGLANKKKTRWKINLFRNQNIHLI